MLWSELSPSAGSTLEWSSCSLDCLGCHCCIKQESMGLCLIFCLKRLNWRWRSAGKVICTIVNFYMSVRPQHTVMKIQDLRTVTCVQVLIKCLTLSFGCFCEKGSHGAFIRIAVRMQTIGQSKWTRVCKAPNCQQVLIPELVCLTPVNERPVSWKGSRSSVWESSSCRLWWARELLRPDWKLSAVVPKNQPFLSQVNS